MPRLTRLFVKAAFVYLVLALAVGALIPLRQLTGGPLWMSRLTPVYLHLFMVGWVTMLIMGVGHWMFPKYSRALPRGHEELAWATLILLNVGLLLRTVAEPALGVQPGRLWPWLLAISAVLQWGGGLCFVVNSWPRIKAR